MQKAKTAVASVPPLTLQRQCACGNHTSAGGECDECRQKRLELQRQGFGTTRSTTIPSSVHEVLRSAGQPLDPPTRVFMESRFGHDFSQVRVHTDGQATDSARAVNALAYTVGQNIVFAAGHYDPGTNSGNRLLAHELAHVIQQSRFGSSYQPQQISPPDSVDEYEAEAISNQVMANEAVSVSQAAPTSSLQRKMLNSVVTDFQKGAKACVVHLHGEERTALAVAKEIRTRRCVNLVHLDTTQRNIEFEITVGGEAHICEADPNRVFSAKGRNKDALMNSGCRLAKGSSARTDDVFSKADKTPTPGKASRADVTAAAATELETFVNDQWGKKISQCRGGNGSTVRNGTLPVLALHNNELRKDKSGKPVPLLDSYKDVAEKGARLPADPKDPKKKMPNPSVKRGEGINDFFLVTDPKDFAALRDTRTVFLQADPVPSSGQDGSLSVELHDQRFINVEKEGRKHDKFVSKGGKFTGPDSIYAKNYAMAAEALDLFGVPDGPCVAAPVSGASKSGANKADTSPATTTRKATTLSTDEPLLEKDELPATAPKGCLLFKNQAELDARRDHWTKKIGRMPMSEILNWIVGVGPGRQPKEAGEALKEMQAQRSCMIEAMRKSVTAQGLSAPTGNIIRSEIRPFAGKKGQEPIWKRKFDFTGGKFGHISDTARALCTSDKLIDPSDTEWDPANKKHKKCWSEKLSPEEKEKEILMTSSAPGVSRHHTGTDFDFGRKGNEKDLTPEAWTGKGDFADAYRWLTPNASTYGFMQPFDTKGGYGKGYMTERWHWSYYPVAQALLLFAKGHRKELDAELKRHWADPTGKAPRPEYKFIWDNWEKFMFNVEEQVVF